MSGEEVDAKLPSLWRNRDFMLLRIGQVCSTIGARATTLAYPLLVLAVTGSPLAAGVVGTLVVALLTGRATLAHVALVAFVEGALFVFFQLAESAALPHVVDRSQLPAALAQNQAREYGAELAGQPLGGVLFGLSRMLPFLFSTVTYVASFVRVLLVRPELQETRERTPLRVVADIREGVAWLLRQRMLSTLVVLIGVSDIVFTPLSLVLIVRAGELGASPAFIGGVFAFLGAGAVLGSLVTPWILRRLRPLRAHPRPPAGPYAKRRPFRGLRHDSAGQPGGWAPGGIDRPGRDVGGPGGRDVADLDRRYLPAFRPPRSAGRLSLQPAS
ncbi:hypothetical protein GCM10022224_055890 [Nonomuraea antimicrobica]|uniref:Transmembrane secretion effector n=1 Tax=Nonomuraea antimicrobica TaxID=561173 RepID=A0ABP7C968_9ACTN